VHGPPVTAIETSRLLLRPWQPDDLGELTRLLTDPEVIRYIVLNESTTGRTVNGGLCCYPMAQLTEGFVATSAQFSWSARPT
jgi:RimJ/RimL family protein N-acetyltransferase